MPVSKNITLSERLNQVLWRYKKRANKINSIKTPPEKLFSTSRRIKDTSTFESRSLSQPFDSYLLPARLQSATNGQTGWPADQ